MYQKCSLFIYLSIFFIHFKFIENQASSDEGEKSSDDDDGGSEEESDIGSDNGDDDDDSETELGSNKKKTKGKFINTIAF